jgi:hypothetical protein
VPAPVPYANLTNPQTLNLYAMVADDPESFADLDGHVENASQGTSGESGGQGPQLRRLRTRRQQLPRHRRLRHQPIRCQRFPREWASCAAARLCRRLYLWIARPEGRHASTDKFGRIAKTTIGATSSWQISRRENRAE